MHSVILFFYYGVHFGSDILLGLMKRLINRRSSNLKVLITSATLDGVKVSRFFSGCPVLNVPGILFPVEKLYSTERPTNYVECCLKTALGRNKMPTIFFDYLFKYMKFIVLHGGVDF